MSAIAIDVEGLSKRYRLGSIGSGSLRQDLHQWLRRYSGRANAAPDERGFLWALQDVSFQVKTGEAMGIVGANGSGKSTLLKIIARIVQPTRGVVKGRGRVSSILEIGAGFHPELSGRENIFINGYTLGMSRADVRRRFDEIVAFSGVEAFLDTPVKRYSSGMYVRLAFAVAAHLEPDVLIVDEVLAVGDAAFQKKCLGKMQEVSGQQGRTVLFVSHNLPAVANLCERAVWLNKGKLVALDNASQLARRYMASLYTAEQHQEWSAPEDAPGNEFIRLQKVQVQPAPGSSDSFILVSTPVQLQASFWCFTDKGTLNINVQLYGSGGECIFNLGSPGVAATKGLVTLTSLIPANLLNDEAYSFSLTVVKDFSEPLCHFSHCISFDVKDLREGLGYYDKWHGLIRPAVVSKLTIAPATTQLILR